MIDTRAYTAGVVYIGILPNFHPTIRPERAELLVSTLRGWPVSDPVPVPGPVPVWQILVLLPNGCLSILSSLKGST